jgi:hypothetical protein
MYNIELKEGQIFEVNKNTGHTYLYVEGEITEITMQEYNIVYLAPQEDRAKALREFRLWKDSLDQ